VIVAPVTKLPLVTILAVFNSGANDDPPGYEGLAQLTAQLLREGTEKRTGLEVVEGFEKLGTSLESGADWDSTIVGMTLLREQLGTGLPLFAEVLTSPVFPEHELNRLKSEQLAERLQILSEPRELADESFMRFLYADGSRYREPMSGNTASISAISRANVEEFFKTRYTPDAITVIVVGDITVDEAVQLVGDSLGEWRGHQDAPGASRGQRISREVQAVELVAKADAAQAELRVGHIGMSRSHPDYFSVVVMNALLGGLFSSRINLNLREEHGYTYGASSYFDWRRDAGPFVIATAVKSEVTGDAISEILKEIDGIRNKEVSAEELSLATSYLEGVFPIRYETTSSIASALATLTVFQLPETFYDDYRVNIGSVTPMEVLNAARNHVWPEKLQIVVVGDPTLLKEPLEKLGSQEVSVQPPHVA
jgi:zinc protease